MNFSSTCDTIASTFTPAEERNSRASSTRYTRGGFDFDLLEGSPFQLRLVVGFVERASDAPNP
jgi:hypothetical protein